MKKLFYMLLCVMLYLCVISGCAKNAAPPIDETAAVDEASELPEVVETPDKTPEPSPASVEAEESWIKNTVLEYNIADGTAVYFTSDISSEGLMSVYNALGAEPEGKVAVKLATGEPPSSNYLRPKLIKDLVQSLNGTIVECKTAYGGQRDSTDYHLQIAKDHGFTEIADFDLMDIEDEISLPVTGGEILKENFVGSHFTDYDYFVVLSHFKGHQMAGYGGAIKNISIGIASKSGKVWIHSGGTKKSSGINGDRDTFLKSMAEAGKSVSDSLNGNILYINVMNRLSIDCDCNGTPREPDMHDIGILASFDPVALDQACLDLVYAAPDANLLPARIDSLNGTLTVKHAAEIGLGSREYTFINIDEL